MENKKILNDEQLVEISGGEITLPSGSKEVELIIKYDSCDNINNTINSAKNILKSKGVPDSALLELPSFLKIYTRKQIYAGYNGYLEIKISWNEYMGSVKCEPIHE